MTSPGGSNVGSVNLRVLPDVSNFRERLRAQLGSATRGIEVKVNVVPDLDGFRQRLQGIAQAGRGISAFITVEIATSVADLRRRLAALVAAASVGLRAEADVDIDQGVLRRLTRSLDSASNAPPIIAALAKAMLALGAVGNLIPVIAGLAQGIANLTPLLLTLPGALLAVGAAGITAKLALSGFFEAVKTGKDLDKLAPSARAAALALRKFGPEYKKIQQLVQQNVFEGLSGPLQSMARDYVPILRKGLGGIATQLGSVAKGFVTALTLPTSKNSVAQILESTKRSMVGLGPATSNVTQAILRLGTVGARRMEGLGAAADKAAARFARFVDAGVSSGSFDRAIDKAVASLKAFWGITKNIGSAVSSVFAGINAGFGSKGISGTFEASTKQLAEFLKTAEAQDGLKGLGLTLSAISTGVRDVFLAALKELAPALAAAGPGLAAFARGFSQGLVDAIKAIGPPLQAFGKWLGDNAGTIEPIARALGHLAAALIAVKIGKGIITALQGFGRAVGGLRWLGKLGLWIGVFELADALDRMNVAAAGGDESKLNPIADSLHNIVGAAKELLSGNLSGILREIGDEWDTLVTKFNTGESPLGAFFQKVKTSFQNDLIVPMENVGTAINTFISSIPGRVSDGLSGLGEVMFGTASRSFGRFYDGASQKFSEFSGWLSGLPGRITGFFGDLPGRLFGSASASFGGFQSGATIKAEEVLGFIRGLPGRILGSLGNMGSLLIGAGRQLMDGLLSGIRAGLNAVLSFASTVAARIRAVKGPERVDKTILIKPGLWIMQGLRDGLSSGFMDVLKDVSDFADQISGEFGNPIDVRVRGSIPALPTGRYTADIGTEVTPGAGIDYELMAEMMALYFPTTIVADGRAIATVVNNSNTRRGRR